MKMFNHWLILTDSQVKQGFLLIFNEIYILHKIKFKYISKRYTKVYMHFNHSINNKLKQANLLS